MKNPMNRIRDQLIKRLGGYTEDEYRTVNRPPIRLPDIVERRNVKRLGVCEKVPAGCLSGGRGPDERFIRNGLAARLCRLIQEYMKMEYQTSYEDAAGDFVIVRAYIDIVED